MKTGVENRLFSPLSELNKAFTTNVSFPPLLRVRSVKTGEVEAMETREEVKTGHTPGPWQILALPYATGRRLHIVTPKRKPIASVDAPQGPDKAQANANLIASAPDLLALLVRYRNETPLGHQPHMIAHEADTVIAKALGDTA